MSGPLPTRQQLLEYLEEQSSRATVRDIARAFGVRGDYRKELRLMMRELKDEGLLKREPGGRLSLGGSLPPVAPLEIIEVDEDGDLWARPISWREEKAPPRILVIGNGRGGRTPALGIGDRILARLNPESDGTYSARMMRAIDTNTEQIIGIFDLIDGSGRLRPTKRRQRDEYAVSGADSGGAQPGELVSAVPIEGRRFGLRQVRITERLGKIGSPRSLSLIAVHSHDIPTEFDPATLAEAAAGETPALGKRTDLRDVPLITIDPEDARDHDDAVWAAPDSDPKNAGGFEIIVAIADVAHFVSPSSALDREALKRGNSVYLPSEVIPMLPGALSADVCSLMVGEDRACLAVRMSIDSAGNIRRHEFFRALMRSAASLNYAQVQKAADGHAGAIEDPEILAAVQLLYAAHEALKKARNKRDPLALELPERKLRFDKEGNVAGIDLQPQLASHHLIEDMMIAANVCAAETLEAKHQPCMYRVHPEPDREKFEALREFLKTFEYNLAKAQVLKPAAFNSILRQAKDTPQEHLIHQIVLRTQSQASYSPNNAGHFGLSLPRYAHFTSPIRRYADILVHRGLINAGRLGKDGLPDDAGDKFAEIGEIISDAERRAMAAERDAVDRISASFLTDRVGATFLGRISGVSRFGLFVTLDETGADGLIPIRTIGTDYYDHDERSHSLIGRRSGEIYRLGDVVEVILREADAVSGRLRFDLNSNADGPTMRRKTPGKRGRRRPRRLLRSRSRR